MSPRTRSPQVPSALFAGCARQCSVCNWVVATVQGSGDAASGLGDVTKPFGACRLQCRDGKVSWQGEDAMAAAACPTAPHNTPGFLSDALFDIRL